MKNIYKKIILSFFIPLVYCESLKIHDFLERIDKKANSVENYFFLRGEEYLGFSNDYVWLKQNLHNNPDGLLVLKSKILSLADNFDVNNINAINNNLLFLYINLYAEIDKNGFLELAEAMLVNPDYPDSVLQHIIREISVKRRDSDLVHSDNDSILFKFEKDVTYSREELKQLFAKVLDKREVALDNVNKSILTQLMGFESMLPGGNKFNYEAISKDLAIEYIQILENEFSIQAINMMPYYKFLFDEKNQPEKYTEMLDSVVNSEISLYHRRKYSLELLEKNSLSSETLMNVLKAVLLTTYPSLNLSDIEEFITDYDMNSFTDIPSVSEDVKNWMLSTTYYDNKDVKKMSTLIYFIHKKNMLRPEVLDEYYSLVVDVRNKMNQPESVD